MPPFFTASLSSANAAVVPCVPTWSRPMRSSTCAIDTAGKAFALRDLARTNSKRVRGPKWLWTPVIGAVNTLGWVAWFAVGKKR